MTRYAFTMPAEFGGPGSSLLEGHLAIEFDHQRAEPATNTYEGVAVQSVRVVIGAQSFDFNGDMEAADIVEACWQHLADEKERIECERADMIRDERGAQ
ncbi:hypothetical protein [Achromobacter sp. 2789STDY5608628]|uniref:hypothetical protein n=1 Tax=Achromobacter sp. 2789STDY5608628 TaxID=1806493 RepID=UPI0006C5142B|nr:hypothetical protein [Achromobacter sp. 2789STDY5608628]CUJ54622.1 Uncharacterised protein [Achromobacter sp. 2789STDY5608628]